MLIDTVNQNFCLISLELCDLITHTENQLLFVWEKYLRDLRGPLRLKYFSPETSLCRIGIISK